MLRFFYSWLPIQYLLISQSPAIWFNSAASDRYEIISYAWFRLWSIEQLTKTVILDDTVRPHLFANEVWNGSCDSHCVGERSTSDTLHRLSFLSCPPRFVVLPEYFTSSRHISPKPKIFPHCWFTPQRAVNILIFLVDCHYLTGRRHVWTKMRTRICHGNFYIKT